MVRQAIVVAGGRGTRVGQLARKHGNKSLVPVAGRPLLLHTIDWIREAGIKSIIVTVNYVAELRKISKMLCGDPAVAVVGNLSRRSSAECVAPLRGLLDPRFFFIYGHAPAPPEHLINLARTAKRQVAVSLYPSCTQRSATIKPASLDGDQVVPGRDGGLFIEPPHILDHEILELLAGRPSWKHCFLNYRHPIRGLEAAHPSEYHDPSDLKKVAAWLRKNGGTSSGKS